MGSPLLPAGTPGLIYGVLSDDSVPAVHLLAIAGEIGSNILHDLLHNRNISFHFNWSPDPAPGYLIGTVTLQAHVLGHPLAVQRKVLSQILKNLLHKGKTPFFTIEARSPAPGHLTVKRSLYLRPMHSAKSTRYSAMVLQNAANSFFMQLHLLFPGPWPIMLACFILACQSASAPDSATHPGDAAVPRRWGVS